MSQDKGWLTALGEQEIEMIREYGRDHMAAKAARKAWTEAYEAVLNIRRNYYLPSYVRDANLPQDR